MKKIYVALLLNLFVNLGFNLVFNLFAFSAHASETAFSESQKSNAQLDYATAIDKVKKAKSALKQGDKISFTSIQQLKEAEKERASKVVWLTPQGEKVETLNANKEAEQNGLNWEHNILIDPSRFPDHPTLVKETETTWTFSLPVKIGVAMEDPQENVDEDKVNGEIRKSLQSELTISKAEPKLLSQKLFSTKAFSPESMVKIKSFLVRIEYAEAWNSGPWVTTHMSQTVKGKYAIFIDVNEFNTVNYSEFSLLNE